ncbi:hypothetical protein A3A39_03200 [Candidatus Kaiserbacteria bacterium RIFCSPLOWO2_01_FULL_54_13]|uniref:Uncharacterized protein n=1 Tax=Candidatus Kaiserbacteria bacterium RIFCSPLOWO2_01_FULL_54_13 TaxID=1798512 RepID=A0A1F6F4A2_9BACT|nr:MAG: hypothetical protein A3A39_03200 [Candidatus Kaiserbacteria bacterium RIFCSPLOWO2_01_FULL_54_13]
MPLLSLAENTLLYLKANDLLEAEKRIFFERLCREVLKEVGAASFDIELWRRILNINEGPFFEAPTDPEAIRTMVSSRLERCRTEVEQDHSHALRMCHAISIGIRRNRTRAAFDHAYASLQRTP